MSPTGSSDTPRCIRAKPRSIDAPGLGIIIETEVCPLMIVCDAAATKRWADCLLAAQGGYTGVPSQVETPTN